MTAPLDARVAELAADPARTWGVRDAVAAILCVPLVLVLTGLLLVLVPAVPGPVGVLVGSVLLGGAGCLVARRPARQSGGAERALGFDLPAWSDTGRMLGWTLLLLIAQVLALQLVSAAIPRLRGEQASNTDFLQGASPQAVVLITIGAVLLAPVVEELLFRGVALRGLMLRLGFWPAALLSSTCFGLLHTIGTGVEALPVPIATGVFGLGLCLLVRRTGRLGPAIGVHALRNAIAVAAVVLA